MTIDELKLALALVLLPLAIYLIGSFAQWVIAVRNFGCGVCDEEGIFTGGDK